MAKKGSFWSEPSRYGTYEGERGNPNQWRAGFEFVFETSDTVKQLVGTASYVALDLLPTATKEEVQKKYRELARIHHPDHGGDPAKFRKITAAYEKIMGKKKNLSQDDPTPRPTRVRKEAPSDDLIIPQLLTPIDETDLDTYLQDDTFGAQEKKDGRHLTLQVKNGVFIVRNKKGIASNCSPEFESTLRSIGYDLLIDGEQIGEKFWVWDILESNGQNLRDQPYVQRQSLLAQIFGEGGPIQVLPLIVGRQLKTDFLHVLKMAGKEGIVFKKLTAPFSPGKGNDQFKFKFYAEASVIVVPGRPGKMSIGMELIDDNGTREFVGYCTCNLIPLPIGKVAEIKYLYAYKGGCLYQSAFKEVRDDVDINECTTSQLKYKSEED